jgi:hypothetical protein
MKTREDGKCENGSCGRPSYSWSSRAYEPKPATTLAVFVPRDDAKRSDGTPMYPLTTRKVCNQHAGILKRTTEPGYTIRFHKPIPEDAEATAQADLTTLRAEQAESRRLRAEYVDQTRAENVAEFLAERDRDFTGKATLRAADEYGRRYITVDSYGLTYLTPSDAEALAERLAELAKEAREAVS